MQAIETVWNGYRFRSRLEARWAIVFESMGADWEYEPNGFVLDDGTTYLPDFLLHDVGIYDDNHRGEKIDLYVEVKGKWTVSDTKKVQKFSGGKPIYLVGDIPPNAPILKDEQVVKRGSVKEHNLIMVDGVDCVAHLGVDERGECALFTEKYYKWYAWHLISTVPYRIAKFARFEHGETPDEYAIRFCRSSANEAAECNGKFIQRVKNVVDGLTDEDRSELRNIASRLDAIKQRHGYDNIWVEAFDSNPDMHGLSVDVRDKFYTMRVAQNHSDDDATSLEFSIENNKNEHHARGWCESVRSRADEIIEMDLKDYIAQ